MAARSRPLEERFWEKVELIPFHPCWEWIGSTDGRRGYGKIRVNGKPEYASRVSYFLEHGVWPERALHTCDNHSCVRPSHIYSGSLKDNARDLITRGQHNFMTSGRRWRLRGDGHPRAILSTEQVQEIRAFYTSAKLRGRTKLDNGLVPVLAKQYGVSTHAIKSLGRGLLR